MPLKLTLGAVAFPAAALAMLLRNKGPAQTFRHAGAVSPETARRPSSLGIGADYLLEPALRQGLLRPTGDGRYYVDEPTYRRLRNRLLMLAGAAGVLLTAVLWLVLSATGAL